MAFLVICASQNFGAMKKFQKTNVECPSESWELPIKTLIEEIKPVIMDKIGFENRNN